MKGRTLRAKLLGFLLVPLVCLWAVDALHTFFTVRKAINNAYDRALYASALAISERVTISGTTPVVDIPPVALEVLDTASQERLFYRVAYRVGGGEERFLTGYADLPAPPMAPSGGASYYDEHYLGEDVRVSALQTAFPTQPPVTVLVQVAETVGGRGSRTHDLVARELVAQLLLIAIAAGIVWLGISRGLRPLTRVSRDVADRDATDLTAIAPVGVPEEVAPLVYAVNGLMARLRATLAAQRRFIADASHQLRTPLAVIQTKAELALREEDPTVVIEALADLFEHSRATTHLAAQLLSLARTDPEQAAGEREVLDLVALARDTCAALVPDAFARGVDLGFEGEGSAPVSGWPHLLREALTNLVQNAVNYGARPGTVTVSVARAGGEAVLAVEDDGPGIPEAERARVLERFYRSPGSRAPGAGLGLAIVKQVADGHGASLVLLEAAAGRGLRAELRFPEAQPPP